MYTIKEMRDELTRIKNEMKKNLDSSTEWAVWKRQDELLEATAVNKTKSGAVRHYLTKSASYKEVDNYLDCLINAMYDVCGFCF